LGPGIFSLIRFYVVLHVVVVVVVAAVVVAIAKCYQKLSSVSLFFTRSE
jgi:hypothetical protein